jgi:hypothetical protein
MLSMKRQRVSTSKKSFYKRLDLYEQHGFKLITKEFPKGRGNVTFLCKCGLEDTVSLEVFLRNMGCKLCDPKRHNKVTNERLDEFLKDKNIIRLGNCEEAANHKPIDFKCLLDNYIWITTPHNILSGKGCPKCAGNLPLSNQEIDEKLSNRPIKRLGDYTSILAPIDWQCTLEECAYIWKTDSNSVINKETGCPKCSKVARLTNEEIDIRLKDREIKRLSNYTGLNSLIEVQCLKNTCGFIWSNVCHSLIYNDVVCPECSSFGKSEKRVGNILKENLNYTYMFPHPKHKRIIINGRDRYPDFYFEIGKQIVIIEYHGSQHYRPTRFFNNVTVLEAEIKFKDQIEKDEDLRQYCKDNNIYFLEIPYWWSEERIIENIKEINNKFRMQALF